MEWQISVWLEFAQEEACIRVKKKKKSSQAEWTKKKKKKKTLKIFYTGQSYNVSPRKKKKCLSLLFCRKFKEYFGEYEHPCFFKGSFPTW